MISTTNTSKYDHTIIPKSYPQSSFYDYEYWKNYHRHLLPNPYREGDEYCPNCGECRWCGKHRRLNQPLYPPYGRC